MRAELITNAPFAVNDRWLLESLNVPPIFGKLTQSAKTNAIALFGGPSHIVNEFMAKGGNLTFCVMLKGTSDPWPLAFRHTSDYGK